MRTNLSFIFFVTLLSLAPCATADTCVGVCGTLGANGVVTLSPTGNSTYQYITTEGGVLGAGEVDGVGGTNGSTFFSSIFAANAGDALSVYFNYVTSDGTGWAYWVDYAWAELQTPDFAHVAWLFTAGDTSLPASDSTLVPTTPAIIPGAPTWSPLGVSSGDCYGDGCGYTGWINSRYSVAAAGNYVLAFGVSNWGDQSWASGLAFDGATIAGTPITGVPEPAALVLLGSVVGALGLLRRRMRLT